MRRSWIGAGAVLLLAACGPTPSPTAAEPVPGSAPAAAISTAPAEPGDVRLTDATDRDIFTGWFTFLAEAMFDRPTGELPREINDCAALLRFAYRESLRRHDGPWAEQLQLDRVPPLGSIRSPTRKSALFRIDEAGTLAEFADARTLIRFNTRRVANDVHDAHPGDLFFYHLPDQSSPYHVMIFLGSSFLERKRGPFVAYHTGPTDGKPGEIRRPSVEELLRHPEPRWRPAASNGNFVGVFRWKILG